MEEIKAEKIGELSPESVSAEAKASEAVSPAVSMVEMARKGVEGIAQVPVQDQAFSQDDPSPSRAPYLSWEGMSSRVGNLLGLNKSKVVKIPSEKVQRIKVKRALEKEVHRMVRKTEQMLGSGRFCADKYEQMVLQIRRFRSMLEELYRIAADTLEHWYRQYVLKSA